MALAFSFSVMWRYRGPVVDAHRRCITSAPHRGGKLPFFAAIETLVFVATVQDRIPRLFGVLKGERPRTSEVARTSP